LLPPVYVPTRTDNVGIKHKDTVMEVDSDAISMLTELLQVEDSLIDSPLQLKITNIRQKLAEKFNLNKYKYYSELVAYYEEPRRIRQQLRNRHIK